MTIRTIGDTVTPEIHAIEMEMASLEKGGYDHFMLKEIFEQPNHTTPFVAASDCKPGSTIQAHDTFSKADRILILGCGTSWHAGLVAEYLFESLARVPVEVEYASEFRYCNPIIRPSDVVIAISKVVRPQTHLPPSDLRKTKGPMSLASATWWGRASPAKPMQVRTPMLGQKSALPPPRHSQPKWRC